MGCCDICGAPLKGKIVHTVQAHREKTPEDTFLVVMCDRCKGLFDEYIERQERKEQFKVVGQSTTHHTSVMGLHLPCSASKTPTF